MLLISKRKNKIFNLALQKDYTDLCIMAEAFSFLERLSEYNFDLIVLALFFRTIKNKPNLMSPTTNMNSKFFYKSVVTERCFNIEQ